MNYDKNSFLAGVSVGRTLKGWATAGGTNPVASGGDIDKLIDGTITTVNSDVKTVRPRAFYGEGSGIEQGLISVSMKNVTTIGDYAFYDCQALSSVIIPSIRQIGDYALKYTSSLKSINAPELYDIGKGAFGGSGIISLYAPELRNIGDYAFQESAIESLNHPNVTSVGQYAFENCTSLSDISMPSVTKIYTHAFNGCTAISEVSFKSLEGADSYAFNKCTSLSKADMGNIYLYLSSRLFYGCSSLDTLILRRTSGDIRTTSSALTGTKIASGNGYIYVPASMISTYQEDSTWSKYKSQFRAIEDYPDICG